MLWGGFTLVLIDCCELNSGTCFGYAVASWLWVSSGVAGLVFAPFRVVSVSDSGTSGLVVVVVGLLYVGFRGVEFACGFVG